MVAWVGGWDGGVCGSAWWWVVVLVGGGGASHQKATRLSVGRGSKLSRAQVQYQCKVMSACVAKRRGAARTPNKYSVRE